MSQDREASGHCGWAALGLVLVFLSGLLPGSVFWGFAGMRIAEFLGLDGAHEFVKRFLILSSMLTGLFVSSLIFMAAALALVTVITRFRRLLSSLGDNPLDHTP